MAFALVEGLDNLDSGDTIVVDHLVSHLARENVHGVAEAYESLGIRAWVFSNVEDLAVRCYTRESFPDFPKAIPIDGLARAARDMVTPKPLQEPLETMKDLIKCWQGDGVQMGLAHVVFWRTAKGGCRGPEGVAGAPGDPWGGVAC